MTWYRMSGSSKGELHGASVLVTVDGEITSGDTVTLSATGYSQTKTLSDVKTALFTDILESGTYTATYKTFSNTVEVSAQDVLDKTTKNVTVSTSTTITLTIEGAKEDNIKIYDSTNTQVASCVFASGQTTGTVDLEIPPTGGTYKFESTVAKDTETGTSNYSKNVSLTNTSSSVKVMPDNCLYWYGNECTDVTGGWSEPKVPTDRTGYNNGTLTRQTNYFQYYSNKGNNYFTHINGVNFTPHSNLCAFANIVNESTLRYELCANNHGNTKFDDVATVIKLKSGTDVTSYDISAFTGLCDAWIHAGVTTNIAKIYSVWLE